jgi:hypothetical protein
MNDFGQLASEIITYDFPNDTGTYGTGYVSGWLEVNLGELNGLTHEEFSGNATGAIEYVYMKFIIIKNQPENLLEGLLMTLLLIGLQSKRAIPLCKDKIKTLSLKHIEN